MDAQWPRLGLEAGVLCHCSFLSPLGCKALWLHRSTLPSCRLRCQTLECVFLAVAAVATGGEWGPMELTPSFASLLAPKTG